MHSNVVQVTVPSKWCDYMKLKRKQPSIFEFVTSKLQLKDSQISDLTQYIIQQSNKLDKKTEASKIEFITDFVCNVYINQFDLNLVKPKAQ